MRLRKGFWIYFPVALFAWLSPVSVSSANAESFTTTGAQDYFFTLEQPQLFTVRTFAQQYGIDSMLWLYDSDNIAISANDDWFGLDSYISMNLNAGTYRLRTGVCCGDPNRWYGTSYDIDVNIAPSNAPSTTTTESTTTTSSTTTSSVPQTTSTESSTTTTLPPETSTSTTEPQTTTTSSTTTTVPQTTTTTEAPQESTTTTTTTTSTLPPVPEPPVVVPTGTTTTTVEETTTTTTLPEETTTTTEPEPETTVPETTTTETYPDTTVAEVTTTTIQDNIVTPEEVAAVVEELTTITEITPEVLSQVVDALNSDNITEEQVQAVVDAVVENLDTLTEITPEVLNEVIDILESDNITQEQVQEVVDTILATDISSDQATQLATSAAVLESITGDQATEVFASIDTGELSGEEAAAIVEALLEAPTEVKEAFEAEINVFEGGFDEYVPTDSTISVGARRVVVAATTVSFILPAPVVSRRQSIV